MVWRFLFVTMMVVFGLAMFCSGQTIADLFDAASMGDLAEVKQLLEGGVEINGKDAQGATPLMAASSEGHLEVVQALLNRHADPMIKSAQGVDALFYACHREYRLNDTRPPAAPIVNLLLDAGANPNFMSPLGPTPLMAAASGIGQPEVVKILLERGADPNLTTKNGETAIFFATSRLSGLLVKEGPLKGRTIRPVPILNNHLAILRILLAKKANVNAARKDGITPLIAAAGATESKEMVDLLISNGADVNGKDQEGATALMHAAAAGNAEIISTLLAKGADINAKDKKGRTAEVHAKKQKKKQVVSLLKKAVSKQ